MKPIVIILTAFFLCSSTTVCAEEGSEHEAKKPPPKPSTASPVEQVEELPAVVAWQKGLNSYKGERLTVWGESLNIVGDQKCWGVVVGQLTNGKENVWRRFCVPLESGEIWVEGNSTDPNADITYMPYGAWVEQCKPTVDSRGSC